MIQLVKRRLRKILGKAQLSYEELLTVLIEVEGVLNSQPLTLYVHLPRSHGRAINAITLGDWETPEHSSASKLQQKV